MSEYTPPDWACSNWGNYEHDWLDCMECLEGYETWLEMETEESSDFVEPLHQKVNWKGEGF
jgi:hypothetical protein